MRNLRRVQTSHPIIILARSLDILLRYLLACSTTPEVKLGSIPVVEPGPVVELGSGLEVELDPEEEPGEGGDLLLSNHPGEEECCGENLSYPEKINLKKH